MRLTWFMQHHTINLPPIIIIIILNNIIIIIIIISQAGLGELGL